MMQICLNTKHATTGYYTKECSLCIALKTIKNLKKRIKVLLKENENLKNS